MFLRLLASIERVGSSLGGILVLVMMVLTTIDVTLRYVFNSPIPGNYELQSTMLAAVAYLGISYVQFQRGHVRMDVVASRLSQVNQLVLQLLGDAIFLFIAALIAWRMGLQSIEAWVTKDFIWGILHVPVWPVKAIITLGTGLLAFRLLVDIIRNPLWCPQPDIKPGERYIRIVVSIVVLVLIITGVTIAYNMELSNPAVGYFAIGLFFVLLLVGAPVASSLALIGVLGFMLMRGFDSALGTAATVPFTATSHYPMTVLPLFIVMGTFSSLAGFAQYGFDLARVCMERITGGIILATTVGATAFAAATGSSIASCAVLAKVTIPEMTKQGVKKGMAIGSVAASATLAIMIPPSGQFVVYGMLTGNSIGRLLIAGIIPGLIGAAMIMIMIIIRCKLDPSIIGKMAASPRTPWKERFATIPRAWGLMFIAVVVLGGIYTGIFTPTEAGAIGAFVALLTVIVTKKTTFSEMRYALLESGGISATVLFILVGGMMFGYMISVTRLPAMLSEWVVSIDVAPILILISIMVVYLILGCFMDTLSTMIITLPIIYPIIIGLGFDPIWYGVLMVQNAEIGSVTPPFGMNLFVLKGLLPDTTLGTIFRGVGWFIVPLVLTMAIYIAFPQVALWLPSMMTG